LSSASTACCSSAGRGERMADLSVHRPVATASNGAMSATGRSARQPMACGSTTSICRTMDLAVPPGCLWCSGQGCAVLVEVAGRLRSSRRRRICRSGPVASGVSTGPTLILVDPARHGRARYYGSRSMRRAVKRIAGRRANATRSVPPRSSQVRPIRGHRSHRGRRKEGDRDPGPCQNAGRAMGACNDGWPSAPVPANWALTTAGIGEGCGNLMSRSPGSQWTGKVGHLNPVRAGGAEASEDCVNSCIPEGSGRVGEERRTDHD
jgi:hypothetical protein